MAAVAAAPRDVVDSSSPLARSIAVSVIDLSLYHSAGLTSLVTTGSSSLLSLTREAEAALEVASASRVSDSSRPAGGRASGRATLPFWSCTHVRD